MDESAPGSMGPSAAAAAIAAIAAPKPAPPRAATDIRPSQTLYINNLNEKVKKAALKKNLYAVFAQFGRIVDIVAAKTDHLRGQAWIVFGDASSTTNALRAMQGFPFYDKPMRLAFAKDKSHAIEKLEGTFTGMPSDSSAETLSTLLSGLFSQYAGYVGVRPVAGRGLAFVEFASEVAAAPALQGLHNFRTTPDAAPLQVSYARA